MLSHFCRDRPTRTRSRRRMSWSVLPSPTVKHCPLHRFTSHLNHPDVVVTYVCLQIYLTSGHFRPTKQKTNQSNAVSVFVHSLWMKLGGRGMEIGLRTQSFYTIFVYYQKRNIVVVFVFFTHVHLVFCEQKNENECKSCRVVFVVWFRG